MRGSHSQTTESRSTPVKKMSSASLTGLDKTPFENTPHLSQPEHSVSPRSRPLLSSEPNSSPRKSLDSAVGSSGSSAGGSGGGGHTIQQVCSQLQFHISAYYLFVNTFIRQSFWVMAVRLAVNLKGFGVRGPKGSEST